jgi:hypothetical protein
MDKSRHSVQTDRPLMQSVACPRPYSQRGLSTVCRQQRQPSVGLSNGTRQTVHRAAPCISAAESGRTALRCHRSVAFRPSPRLVPRRRRCAAEAAHRIGAVPPEQLRRAPLLYPWRISGENDAIGCGRRPDSRRAVLQMRIDEKFAANGRQNRSLSDAKGTAVKRSRYHCNKWRTSANCIM